MKRAPALIALIAVVAAAAFAVESVPNPLDKPAQEGKPLNAGEMVSFLLERSDPATGLVPTSVSATRTANPGRELAYTYTQALAHQAFLLTGQAEAASKIAEFFRGRQAMGPLPAAFDFRTGLCKDPAVAAGPNAYWGISFIKQYLATKEGKWLDAAKVQAEFLLKLQDPNGGIKKSPFDSVSEYYAKSTEENLDCYAFFDLLYGCTGDNKYKDTCASILKWLAASGVYNDKEGYFYLGTYKDEVTTIYGTDANALAIVILGPGKLDAGSGEAVFGGSDTARRALESLARAQAKIDYKHPGRTLVKDVTGYDFTDSAGRPGRPMTISPEFTSQAALAYLVMADHYKEKGDLETARSFAERSKALLDDLGRIAARTGRSASLPYSTEKRIRRFAFDNWVTSDAEADISSTWIVFPLSGFDPFSAESFKLRDSLLGMAPWLGNTGEVAVAAKISVKPQEEKIKSEAELTAEKEAAREESFKQPVVYYEVLYDKVQRDAMLARRRIMAVLMTSFNCWVDGRIEAKDGDYGVIGIDKDNKVIKKKLSQMPGDVAAALKEEYIYLDKGTGIKWRLVKKYNLNADFSKGMYYAFEVGPDYSIIRTFRKEGDVPEANRADLLSVESQFQSVKGLPEGNVIARFLPILEVDSDMKILKVYDNVDQVPGMVSKVMIDSGVYKKYMEASGEKKKELLAAGIVANKKGAMAEEDWGKYFARVLAIDETKRLRISGVSAESGNEVFVGTRFTLSNTAISELAKLNAMKYEDGLINGMVIEPYESANGSRPSVAEPVSIFLDKTLIEERTKEFRARLLDLLRRVKAEKDAQARQELLSEYDMLSGSQAWYDNDGYVHVIYYGAKAAEKRLKEFDVAKKRAESSLREYDSILGRDEKGRDLRDFYGNVWLKVINAATGRVLYVEVYDIGGNLLTIYADNIKIDPLTKVVSSDTRTDIEYDKETYQMIGSHTYRTDENGDWVADVSEGIFRGYTPDKDHFTIERRIYQKNENGRILFDKNGKPRFTKKIEYYTPEGDIAAQVVRNIVTRVKYGQNHETTREVFIDPSYGSVKSEGVNLDELIEGRVWVRRYKSVAKISSFRDILVSTLTALPQDKREAAADAILNRLGAEQIGRANDAILLEENEVTNNLSEDPQAEGEAPYFVFYEPGDSLGRQRLIIRGGTIEVPVEWLSGTDIAAKTLTFNLVGELASSNEVEKFPRADSAFGEQYLKRLSVFGIEPDTLLPQSNKRIFRLVTGPDGVPHFTNTVSITTVSYLIPDDVLGRELESIKYVMLGNDTTLHKDSKLEVRTNLLNQDIMYETWKDDRGEPRKRPIAKKEETVIYEWYNEGMTREELRAAVIEDVFLGALSKHKVKSEDLPRTFEGVRSSMGKGKLKPSYMAIGLEELKEALDNVGVPPFGTLPAYHTIRSDGKLGEIKYFSGFVEYPRSIFSHPEVSVPYEPAVKAFSLPDGPPIKGVKYGVLNSDYAFYDVHSLSGQLIVLERRFIILRLMNILPIQGGKQTEYYDPLVPYSYLKPIKIERDFKPGTQPDGTQPGVQIVGVFLGDASIYHRNGWQTQTFLERRPFDIDHWIRSDYEFDDNGIYKYKKEHIESSSIYLMKTVKWHRPLLVLLLFAGLFAAIGYFCRKRLSEARDGRIRKAELDAKSGIASAGAISPFSRECLARLEESLTAYGAEVDRADIDELKTECVKVYQESKPPTRLREIAAKVYGPLLEKRFMALGADPSGYSSSIEVIVSRISARLAREDINARNLFAVEIKGFEEWSGKCGRGIKVAVEGPGDDGLAAIALFRLIFDESMEFRAAVSGIRNFLLEKGLDMLSSGRGAEALKEIRSDVQALLGALKPGYDKKLGLTKDRIFTYEDMNDLFEGKRRGFIKDFAGLSGRSADEKLLFLAANGGKNRPADPASHKSYLWLKTYPDKPGVLRFIANIRRFIVFLVPIFSAVVLGGVAIALDLIPPAGQGVAGILLKITVLIALGVAFTVIMLKVTLGGGKESGAKARLFWLMFTLASYLWGVFSIYVIIWTVKIIAKLSFVNAAWGMFISGSALLLTFTFIISSFFSLFYIIIAFFGFYQGQREGVGQVISWKDLKKNFETSKQRFKQVMVPAQSRPDPRRSEELWQVFWNAMIKELYDYCILNGKESDALAYLDAGKGPDLGKMPRADEARDRIRYYVNSWLMDMPKADFWTNLPSLTAMITAFSEPVSFSFDELNGCDRGAEVTRLNHLIGYYRPQWEEFVGRLGEPDLGAYVSKDQLKSLFGLKRLPDGLPGALKEKISRWANLTVQCVEKTAVEVYRIRDAFKMYARACYPAASDTEIDRLVSDKVQILLNYEGYHKPFTRDSDKIAIQRLMKEMPELEVYWDAAAEDLKGEDRGLHRYNPAAAKAEICAQAPFIVPIKKGKPSGLNQAISFVRGETILFFDANCSVRIEDALKIPVGLSEFREDPRLGEVLFAEYIFNKNYSWISQAIGFNEETFVSVTQRTLNIFHACGFYGHSAIIRTDMITSANGFPQDYISEDILLATSFWQKGFKTSHREYILFGKGRETSYFTSLVPLTKWAMGASDAAIGRVMRNILGSSVITVTQKFMLMFGFSFFYQTPLMFIINFLYLWLMICWGINGFMSVPYPIVFGILGLLFNQAITATGVAYLFERYGIRRSFSAYIRLVAKNHFFYASVIPAYAFGFLAGLKGKAVFIISPKGWNLGHLPLKAIWGEKRDILKVALLTTILGLPMAYILVAMKRVPLWISPFIPFLPFAVVATMFILGSQWKRIGIPYLKNWRDEIVPDGDISKISVIKLQMIYAIVLLVFTGVGFMMWGLVFSSLAVKALFIFSALYISTTLSFVIMPLFAHSQPIAIFKDLTLSRRWNYFIIPLFGASVLLGMASIFTSPATATPELVVYTLFGLLLLILWGLLQWKLSGYRFLNKWLRDNLPAYRRAPEVLKTDVMDDLYFAHQELMQGDRNYELAYLRFLKKAKAVFIATLLAVTSLYFASELNAGCYSPWLWLLVAAEAVCLLALNVRHTQDDRAYLRRLYKGVILHDFNRINETVRASDDIWKKLDRDYKGKLVRTYDDEIRAKKALADYMSRCSKSMGQVVL